MLNEETHANLQNLSKLNIEDGFIAKEIVLFQPHKMVDMKH